VHFTDHNHTQANQVSPPQHLGVDESSSDAHIKIEKLSPSIAGTSTADKLEVLRLHFSKILDGKISSTV
jgi:hypothetical protein